MIPHRKPHNILRDKGDVNHASRIVSCVVPACTRKIVEYGLFLPETRHAQGLPEETMQLAKEIGVCLVQHACDHHGGQPYSRPQLNV